MKKVLIGLLFGVVLVGASANAFADSIAAGTLGFPITMIEDTSILGAFPSRLQTVGMGKSALFVGVSGGAIGFGGFDLKVSPLLDILYVYRGPSVAIPTVLDDNVALYGGGGTMENPIAFTWGAKLGAIQLGLAYSLQTKTASLVLYETNGTRIYEDRGNYQLHTIQPGLTLKLGDKASLDFSVAAGLQVLDSFNLTTGSTNTWSVSAPLKTLNVLAQFNTDVSSKFRIAVRAYGYHTDNGYTSISRTGVTSTNEYIYKSDNLGAVLAFQYKPVDTITMHLSFTYGRNEMMTIPEFTHPSGSLTTTDTITVSLLPSTSLGMEVKAGNWRFRGYGSIAYSKTIIQAYNPSYTGPIGTTSANNVTYGAALGIGWVKLPWAINLQFNPDLLNSTIDLISGNPLGTDPILSIQVNYLFDINAPAAPANS